MLQFLDMANVSVIRAQAPAEKEQMLRHNFRAYMNAHKYIEKLKERTQLRKMNDAADLLAQVLNLFAGLFYCQLMKSTELRYWPLINRQL